jgi:hypothetical protein
MRLRCPSCGAIASADTWANDSACRQCLQVGFELPSAVQQRVLQYLGLFRKGKCGLPWTRALRLFKDLRDLVARGTVQWDGGEERPASPMLWADALDAVLARRPHALENHNYLRRVAWEMAKGGAARTETRRELDRQAKSGAHAQLPVIPAQAGIQEGSLDPGLRRGDDRSRDGDRGGGDDHGEQRATREQIAAVKQALKGFLAKE